MDEAASMAATAAGVPWWVTVLLVTLGGLIASAVPLLTALLNNSQARTRLAVEAAIQEHKMAHEIGRARIEAGAEGFRVPPLAGFVFYNSKLVVLASRGRLNRRTLENLNSEFRDLRPVFETTR